MLNPDINDSHWQAGREKLWKVIEERLKKDFRKKEIAVVHEIFFTGNFDLNKPDHKLFFEETGDAWEFSFYPIQTKESWTKYFTETLPNWYKPRTFNLVSAATQFARINQDYHEHGWDVKTEIELHQLLLGNTYTPGEIDALGYRDLNPVFPHIFVRGWCGNILNWYINIVDRDNKWVYLKDYWLSCLPYLDIKYYYDKKLSGRMERQVLVTLQQFLYSTFHIDQQKIIEQARKNSPELEDIDLNDISREDYAKQLQADLETIDGPNELVQLIEVAKDINFKPLRR